MRISTRVEKVLENKSIYCYSNGVLKNKLNIKDKEELDKVEASLSYLRLRKLEESDIRFSFDTKYYLQLHNFIFQDIYNFAGEIRSENISKSVKVNINGETENIPFCRPEFIYTCLKEILEKMKKNALQIKTYDEYIEYLSYYYAEINIIHPFREGNGRTQREYFRQLVEVLNKYLPLNNIYLDYSDLNELNRNNLIQGCINSAFSGDLTLLKEFFKSTLKEKEYDKTKTV
ncbi:MAG: hypothetical protein E7170_04425 [Firmicutes bacterium]|nr:hypothetical protein [Bacillota bacterium]